MDEEFEFNHEKVRFITVNCEKGDGFREGITLRIGLKIIDRTRPPLVKKGMKIFPTTKTYLPNITRDEYAEYLKFF